MLDLSLNMQSRMPFQDFTGMLSHALAVPSGLSFSSCSWDIAYIGIHSHVEPTTIRIQGGGRSRLSMQGISSPLLSENCRPIALTFPAMLLIDESSGCAKEQSPVVLSPGPVGFSSSSYARCNWLRNPARATAPLAVEAFCRIFL